MVGVLFQNKKMKVCVISCYMGSLPSWMAIWLKSCEYNPEFDFLLVTDDGTEQDLPPNVKMITSDLYRLKLRFQELLPFEIRLETPYKLCDYKPLYGLAFKEQLIGYDFWGYCDLDMVFGALRHFITDEIMETYDRIGTFGHLSLYRNNDWMNHIFEKKGGAFSYRTVFQSSLSYGFDERYGMNLIFRKQGVRFWNPGHALIADKVSGVDGLMLSHVQNYESQMLLWKNGAIYHAYIDKDGHLKKKEKMYYHFSSTQMKIPEQTISHSYYLRADSCMERKTGEATAGEVRFMSDRIVNSIYTKKRIGMKLKRFMGLSFKKKYIYVRQKLAYWSYKK